MLKLNYIYISFQVIGIIAKGSFGPILKVKDWAKGKTYAVKVNFFFLWHNTFEELEICAVLLQTVLLMIRFYPNLWF